MDELLSDFLTETAESLEQVDAELVAFEKHPENQEILRRIFRLVHTIKGTCGFLDLPRLEALTHAAETLMGQYRDGAPVVGDGVETILRSIDRVKEHLEILAQTGQEPEGDDQDLIAALNDLAADCAPADQFEAAPLYEPKAPLDLLEEAFRNTPGPDDPIEPQPTAQEAESSSSPETNEQQVQVPAVASGGPVKAPQAIRVNLDVLENLMNMVSELVLTRNQLIAISRTNSDSDCNAPLQRLCSVTAELQEGVMKTRMQPISAAWQKMPRLIRDLSKELGKDIRLEMEGEDTELDRQILEQIKDPLTHMVRNAADHGLEDTQTRADAGKPHHGTVHLNAFHEGGQIVIEISDDGRGLNIEALRKKALEKGIATEAELAKMSDTQIHQLIFHPGFSTAASVTSVSGRGVGMDVVRANVELIGGTIDLKSQQGAGTTVSLKIPLTLAIVPALIIAVGEEQFALPQRSVRELVRVNGDTTKVERLNGNLVLQLRDHLLPVMSLSDLLGISPGHVSDKGFVVVVEVGPYCFGLLVDEVFHTEEIVVKPMNGALQGLTHFSGTTILGDGSVIMIMDPSGLASSVANTDLGDLAHAHLSNGDAEDEIDNTDLLLFSPNAAVQHAVPLALVNRLETVSLDQLEEIDQRFVLQYRDQLMPVQFMCDVPTDRAKRFSMLVFDDAGRQMGLVVEKVLDIIAEKLEIDPSASRSGYLGTSILNGRATEILDISHFMSQAHPQWLERQRDYQAKRRFRLLYAEDSPFFRNMLVPIFNSAGFDVTVCEDGNAAYHKLELGSTYDLIVTDIEMPGMDGFTLAESVAHLPNAAQTPIIALSAYDDDQAQDRAREVGLFDFVSKSDRSHLTEAVARAIGQRELEAA